MQRSISSSPLPVVQRLARLVVIVLLAGPGWAAPGFSGIDEDAIFADRFAAGIERLLPVVDGEYQLPNFALSEQLRWIIAELHAAVRVGIGSGTRAAA